MESDTRAPEESSELPTPSAARSGERHAVAAAQDALHDLVRDREVDGIRIATGPFDNFEGHPSAARSFDQKIGHVSTVAIARTLACAEEDNAPVISLRNSNQIQEFVAARSICDSDAAPATTADVGVAELPQPLIPGLANHSWKAAPRKPNARKLRETLRSARRGGPLPRARSTASTVRTKSLVWLPQPQ